MKSVSALSNCLMVLLFVTLPILTGAQSFVKGILFTNDKDSVSCNIVKLKKREESYIKFIELQIIDSLGSVKKIYPKDIQGYIKEDSFYKSVSYEGVDIFMQLIVPGKVPLYYHKGEAGDEKYIFKRSSEKDFNFMDYDGQFNKMNKYYYASFSASRRSLVPIIAKNPSFINFFTKYFEDCPALARKIKIEFYTRSDMADIFKDYNKVSSH